MDKITFGSYEVIKKTKTSVILKTDGGEIKVLSHEEYNKLTAKVALVAQEKKTRAMKFQFGDEIISLYDWAKKFDILPSTALRRIEAGQTIEECLLNKRAKYLKPKINSFTAHLNDGSGNALCKPNYSKKWHGINEATYICGGCRKKKQGLSYDESDSR